VRGRGVVVVVGFWGGVSFLIVLNQVKQFMKGVTAYLQSW